MLKTSLKYGAVLIAIYLVAANSTNAGNIVKNGAAGAVDLTKALQGR